MLLLPFHKNNDCVLGSLFHIVIFSRSHKNHLTHKGSRHLVKTFELQILHHNASGTGQWWQAGLLRHLRTKSPLKTLQVFTSWTLKYDCKYEIWNCWIYYFIFFYKFIECEIFVKLKHSPIFSQIQNKLWCCLSAFTSSVLVLWYRKLQPKKKKEKWKIKNKKQKHKMKKTKNKTKTKKNPHKN